MTRRTVGFAGAALTIALAAAVQTRSAHSPEAMRSGAWCLVPEAVAELHQ